MDLSQYTFSDVGSSACTAIAASVLKLLLLQVERGCLVIDKNNLTDAVFAGVSYFHSLHKVDHLSMDEVGPIMNDTLRHLVDNSGSGVIQGMISDSSPFDSLFNKARDLADPRKYIGIVITKPPETVCVVLPPSNNRDLQGYYMLFDSHSRPQFGFSGSYLVASPNKLDVIQRLQALFPPFPAEENAIVNEQDYMHLMYNMFEGSIFQLK